MDERKALAFVGGLVEDAGDDTAVVDDLVVTTDMLHDRTDFPAGTSRYTAGWRAVGASLSDVAAMGASATAAVAVYASPTFDQAELKAFVEGAQDVCAQVDGEYVGGDLDTHEEFTVATTAIGKTDTPITRGGATPGDALCVTGTLGRSGAALELFETGEIERANELFRFQPRIAAGRALTPYATAMLDSSDGLARSVHQLADASGCGVEIDSSALPIDETVDSVAENTEHRRELGVFFGEDFELVVTIPEDELEAAMGAVPCRCTQIGTVVEEGCRLDGEPFPDRGYTHGT